MPVTRISDSVDCSAKPGASAWIGRCSSAFDRALLVDRLADDVQDAAQRGVAHGHHDRPVGVGHFLAADQTFGRVHRDRADGVLAEVLRDFQNQLLAVVVGGQRVQDLRQVIVELHVNHGADDLGHFAFCVCHVSSPVLRALPRPK